MYVFPIIPFCIFMNEEYIYIYTREDAVQMVSEEARISTIYIPSTRSVFKIVFEIIILESSTWSDILTGSIHKSGAPTQHWLFVHCQ